MVSSAPLTNIWHRRTVAATSAKSCWICYKPSSTVLVTPDNKDYFYVCAGHLRDRAFAIPDADEVKALEEKRKKEDLDREIELLKREYEEKQKKKAEKRKEQKKDGDFDKSKEKERELKEAEEDKRDESEKEAKIIALKASETKQDDEPRIFALAKTFYQQRIDRIRNAEMAKRNRERIKDPTFFPSPPTGNP